MRGSKTYLRKLPNEQFPQHNQPNQPYSTPKCNTTKHPFGCSEVTLQTCSVWYRVSLWETDRPTVQSTGHQVLLQPCSQGLSCSVWRCRKDPGNERNLKIAFKTIGLFRVAPSLCFKMRLSAKPLIWKIIFYSHANESHFHEKKILHVASFWQWEFLALRNGLLIWALFSCSEAIKQELYIVKSLWILWLRFSLAVLSCVKEKSSRLENVSIKELQDKVNTSSVHLHPQTRPGAIRQRINA